VGAIAALSRAANAAIDYQYAENQCDRLAPRSDLAEAGD
jgi:hypothetical protein